MSLLTLLQRPQKRRVRYLLRDEFTTPAAAPLTSPRRAEPGPGTWTLVQTDGQFSIADKRLVFTAQATPVAGDLRATAAAVQREAGLAMLGTLRVTGSTTGVALTFGFDAATTGEVDSAALRLASGVLRSYSNGAISPSVADVWATNVDYEACVILLATGAYYFVRNGYSGGSAGYPEWTLFWLDRTSNVSTLYPAFASLDAPGQLGYPRLVQLGAGAATLSTDSKPTTAADDTITMTPDAVIEHTITAATGVTQSLMFRYTDASNHWFVELDQTNSTMKLFERVAGVDTQRGSTATQAWTNGTPYRIVVICDGAVVRTYTPSVSNAARNAYTTATTGLSATIAKVSHAGSAFYSTPRRPSLPATVVGTRVKILSYGDSKTDGTGDESGLTGVGPGYQPPLHDSLNPNGRVDYYIWKQATGGITTQGAKDAIDAYLLAETRTPNYVLYNLGANDLAVDATWLSNTAYILDAMHVKWSAARIYLMRVYVQGQTSLNTDRADGIDTVLSTRGAWAFVGPDERVFLENGDGGATYMADSKHPNHAGYALTAAQWGLALGL
jgi:lysophospholipase L1-like esterase